MFTAPGVTDRELRYMNTLMRLVIAFTCMASAISQGKTVMGVDENAQIAEQNVDFTQRFLPLKTTILDENAIFSGSQMHRDLLDLLPMAESLGKQSRELGELYAMLALVQGKRGVYEDELAYGEASLDILSSYEDWSVDKALLERYRLAVVAGELGLAAKAIDHLRVAVEMLPASTVLDEQQIFGVRQKLGYWLHEAGRYAEAYDYNLVLLEDAERTFGMNDLDINGILTNLAQNAHAMQKLDRAEHYLKRCLDLASRHNDNEIMFDMLFQLGVVAFERGDAGAAEDYFRQRIDLARTSGDNELIEQAEETLQELYARMSGG